MAFWSGETLKERLPQLVHPYDDAAIDCAAYTLRVGSEVYVSPDRQISAPDRHTKRMLPQGDSFTIPPGQFAFLVTEERIKVPDDAVAFISIKAKLKFNGLINISGFHVDPGYDGHLLFSVLNAGPRPLHLQRGQPLFLIWYAALDRVTAMKKEEAGFAGIKPDMLTGISGEIQSLQRLSEDYRELERRFDVKLNEIQSRTNSLSTLVNVFVGLAVAVIVGFLILVVQIMLS
ncbi:deoxycytidine triphosphate deaminase (plasmid) [Acuticoccus sp. MNP-M23]|uniref:dCTP deaminase domain-containing protein n=1 Tax=Acuticoccus sp. MNP-M23 TaxID=3072793 RepID=UPI002814BD92|nr:deoxycytidine triphosphate deaminase [Acuticoccus sp. MNP-M23]WMS45207.1 deoxycytidine triphosphate deaminase [Acuticoccus sp. MNP-M23]